MTQENVAPSETVKVYTVPETPITEEVLAHIQAIAKGMLRHSSHSQSDYEDICQDLVLEVIRAFGLYDRTRSSYYTYAQIIISRGRDYIYRKRMRKGLDVGYATIDSIDGSDPLLIDERALSPEMALENKERAAIIRDVVSGLTPFQQRICNMIMDDIPMNEIMARCHLTQSQFYHRVWPAIQQAFKKSLKKYQK